MVNPGENVSCVQDPFQGGVAPSVSAAVAFSQNELLTYLAVPVVRRVSQSDVEDIAVCWSAAVLGLLADMRPFIFSCLEVAAVSRG